MSFSIPSGTLAVLPATQLDFIKRYQECIANFACEIRGRDSARCIQAISPMVHELETMTDGSYRVHKPTEPQARLIQQQVINWVASSPESRSVEAYPVSTDHTAQQAKDVSNTALGAPSAVSFNGGIAVTGGPWTVEVETNAKGETTALHFYGPGHERPSPAIVEAAKKFDWKAELKQNQELEAKLVGEADELPAPAKKSPGRPKSTRKKVQSSTRKRPTKSTK